MIKEDIIKEEIKEFLKYYPNSKVNYQDYFYSHTLDNGEIVSLETFIKENNLSKEEIKYYQYINDEFINEIFNGIKPLYFFDVDNTITISGRLSKEKKEFILNFKDKNRIILSTGKAYESILDVINACALEDNYASCINGSVLVKNNKYEMINGLGDISEELIERIIKTNIDFMYYYTDGAYVIKELNKYNKDNMEKYNEYYKINANIDYNKVVKILLFIYDGEKEKEDLIKDLIKDYKNLTCMRTAPHSYEILKYNQHKGNTVKIISNRLNHYYRASIGVGDSMNDLRMLDYVGLPFVVCDANSSLKEYKFKELDSNREIDIVKLIEEYK